MPNPLRPTAHFLIAPGAICERPQLALQALTVISACAAAEYQVGSLLATVVGEGAREVITSAIDKRISVRQREMLADHAERNLGEEELDLVSAFLRMASSIQKARNPLVHWLSGYSDDHPDGVLYLNPTLQWRFDAGTAELLADGPSQPPRFDYRNISVYVKRDFDQIGLRVNELNEAAELIKFLLRSGLPGPGRVYDRLRGLPQYAAELETWQEDRRKASERAGRCGS